MSNYKKDVQDFIKQLTEQATDKTTADLAIIGAELLPKAFDQSTYTNRTYNLSDSYGWGVYYNGKLERKGYLLSAVASEPHASGKDGRTEVENFLSSYKARDKGHELIFVAAMFYAGILESGVGLSTKYVVISSIKDDLEAIFGADKVKRLQW